MSQDYIMRMISQLGRMLAGIVAKRSAGKLAEAKQELDEWSSHAVGMPLGLVRQMSPQALHQHLYGSGSNDYTRALLIAELLMQDAEILETQNDQQQALIGNLHAFNLIYDARDWLTASEKDEYMPKLETLAEKLRHLPPNPYLTEKLAALKLGA